MRFNRDSGLVKVWVKLVRNGIYTREQIPEMYNLRETVEEILDGQKEGVDDVY